MQTNALGSTPPLTVEILMEAIEKLKAIPKNDKWLVVDPQGQMYEGTVEQVTKFVLEQHPLLKKPLHPMPFKLEV